jgi:hypothetical protein
MKNEDCPPEGCQQVQYLTKHVDDAADRAAECLEKTASLHTSIQGTLVRVETIMVHQADRVAKISQLEVDIAVLKNEQITMKDDLKGNRGSSTPVASVIASAFGAAAAALYHFFVGDPGP